MLIKEYGKLFTHKIFQKQIKPIKLGRLDSNPQLTKMQIEYKVVEQKNCEICKYKTHHKRVKWPEYS